MSVLRAYSEPQIKYHTQLCVHVTWKNRPDWQIPFNYMEAIFFYLNPLSESPSCGGGGVCVSQWAQGLCCWGVFAPKQISPVWRARQRVIQRTSVEVKKSRERITVPKMGLPGPLPWSQSWGGWSSESALGPLDPATPVGWVQWWRMSALNPIRA